MTNYLCQLEYDIEASSPEEAAHILSTMVAEGLIYSPVVDVYSGDGEYLATVDTEEN